MNIQALDSACSYNFEFLSIKINEIYQVPTPPAEITAPDYYSVTCSKNSLQFSASLKSTAATYSWKPSEKTKVSELISTSTSTSIEIPKSLLSVSELNIELTVTFESLNTWAKSSKTIQIVNKDYLEVELNVGSFNQIK